MMYSIHVLFDNANMKTTMSIILPKTSQAIMRLHFRIITCMNHSGAAEKRRTRCSQKQCELSFLGQSGIFPFLSFFVGGQRFWCWGKEVHQTQVRHEQQKVATPLITRIQKSHTRSYMRAGFYREAGVLFWHKGRRVQKKY